MGGSPRAGGDKKSKCKGRRGATLAPPALQMGTRNRTSLAAPGSGPASGVVVPGQQHARGLGICGQGSVSGVGPSRLF